MQQKPGKQNFMKRSDFSSSANINHHLWPLRLPQGFWNIYLPLHNSVYIVAFLSGKTWEEASKNYTGGQRWHFEFVKGPVQKNKYSPHLHLRL